MKSLGAIKKVAGGLSVLIFIAWATMFLVDAADHRSDRIALTAADLSTQRFHQMLSLGDPESDIQQMLASKGLHTLRRGTDTLIIAREGRGVWYCSHNYFGTALSFKEGKLVEIKSDEWLDTCL